MSMNSFHRLIASPRGFDWSTLILLCLVSSLLVTLFGIVGCGSFRYNQQIAKDQPSQYASESHWWMVSKDVVSIKKPDAIETPPACKALEFETEPNNCNH